LKKPQLVVALISTLSCFAIVFFVPRTNKTQVAQNNTTSSNQAVSTQTVLDGAKTALTASQKISLLSIENQLVNAKSTADSIKIYRQLSKFWADSAQRVEPYLYYTYSAALLENSEKSLTFAAQQLVDNLTSPDAPPAILNWIASNAKVLLEKALVMNPNNDSTKINLGACYLFGNISDNPMQGILKVKEVVDKNPQNIYGQMMLGLGGKKSGQYPKAIERFTSILKLSPSNLEAMVNLAECYELNNQEDLAIEWYTKMKVLVNNPAAKEAIEKRIKELKKSK
jgi:tetratricopeptide (TPR) repeat protein